MAQRFMDAQAFNDVGGSTDYWNKNFNQEFGGIDVPDDYEYFGKPKQNPDVINAGFTTGQYDNLRGMGFDDNSIITKLNDYLTRTGNTKADVAHWGGEAVKRVMGMEADPNLERQQQNTIAADMQRMQAGNSSGLSGSDWMDILKGGARVYGAGTLGNMFNMPGVGSAAGNIGAMDAGVQAASSGWVPNVSGMTAASGTNSLSDGIMDAMRSGFNSGQDVATSGLNEMYAGPAQWNSTIPGTEPSRLVDLNGLGDGDYGVSNIAGTNTTSVGDYATQFTGGGTGTPDPSQWIDTGAQDLANMSGNVQASQSGNLWDKMLSSIKSGMGNELTKATNNPISTGLALYGGLRNMFSEQTRANDIRNGYNAAAERASPVSTAERQRYQALLSQAMANPESLIQPGGPLAGITDVYNNNNKRLMAAKGKRLNPVDLQNENYKTFLGTILPNYTKQLSDLGGFQFNPGDAGRVLAAGITPATQAEANSQGALPFALQTIFGRANTPTRGVNGQLIGA